MIVLFLAMIYMHILKQEKDLHYYQCNHFFQINPILNTIS